MKWAEGVNDEDTTDSSGLENHDLSIDSSSNCGLNGPLQDDSNSNYGFQRNSTNSESEFPHFVAKQQHLPQQQQQLLQAQQQQSQPQQQQLQPQSMHLPPQNRWPVLGTDDGFSEVSAFIF